MSFQNSKKLKEKINPDQSELATYNVSKSLLGAPSKTIDFCLIDWIFRVFLMNQTF